MDPGLRPELRLDPVERHAVRQRPAVPAALLYLLVDHDEAVRRRQLPALLPAPALVGAEAVVDQHGDTSRGRELPEHRVLSFDDLHARVARELGAADARWGPWSEQPAPTAQTPTGIPGWRVLTYTALGLLAGAVLAAPATIRVRRRHRRLSRDGPSDDQVEAAWAEIRDTVIDTGGRWPAGSPRRIGGDIASRLDAPEAATMTRIATLVEQSRYARHIAHEDTANQLPELTRQVRTGLAGELSGPRRLLSRVAPRSLLPPTSRRPKKGPHQTHPGD